jgi:hypothetical protein
MFAEKFYTAMGAAPDAKISTRFTHSGLAGRTLKSASTNRLFFGGREAHDQISETVTVIVLGKIRSALVEEVQRVCAPMFILFNFQEFASTIYEDIVRRFEKGEVT